MAANLALAGRWRSREGACLQPATAPKRDSPARRRFARFTHRPAHRCVSALAAPLPEGARPRRRRLSRFSEAVILQEARRAGVGRKMGRAIVFSPDDIKQLYEAHRHAAPLVRRPKSPYWIIRGSIRGVRVEESTGVGDRKVAEEIRAKRESALLEEAVYGRRATATFAEAALSYLEAGGAKRFLEPVIRHFGVTPLGKIDQDAIDKGSRKLYPKASDATRVRQFYTPTSAVLAHGAKRGWCAPLIIERPKVSLPPFRWLTPDKAERLIEASAITLGPWSCFCSIPAHAPVRRSGSIGANVDLTRGHVSSR